MASTSVRPTNSVPDSAAAAAYDFSRSFQNLGLENHDGFFNTSPGIAASSSSSISPPLNLFPAETQEGDLEFPLNQPIRQEANLGYHPLNNGGDFLHSNMCSASENLLVPMDDLNRYYNPFGRNPVPGNPSNCYPGMGNCGVNYYPELYFRGQIGSKCSNNLVESSAIRSNRYYFGNDDNLPSTIMQSPGGYSTGQSAFWGGLNEKNFLERRDKAMLATENNGSNGMLGLLEIGDPSNTSLVLDGVIDYLMVLVTHEDGFKVFRSLIGQCDHSQMVTIVEKMTSDAASLGMVVGTQFGSYSVQSLIRRLRRTDLARLVTSALSFDICGIVLTTWGRNVIKQCFTVLDRRANEVLHDAVIANYYELAMDRGGCITVSNCIETIESPQRGWLLDRLCEESACLSLDPSGTYVVQKVLGLGSRKYSSMICERLQGNYIPLSLIKHGSYTVEKCLKACGCRGLDCFSKDIAEDKSLLAKLARHEFGNFVVRAALEVSKMEPSGKYYLFFVKILEPCFPQLEKNKYGVHVVRQIQGRGETRPGNKFGRHY
ncbi:pumilio homolog 12-like [Rhododendron vialii]|uniref:pumilio homolog 12-like n=1 Tax=Rhododendron vialii TaxID=182163 RepID=UPI0026605304|nr:pumilio homolog 12-like [Rhododendron vialii]